jgi:uncharacterized protein YacL
MSYEVSDRVLKTRIPIQANLSKSMILDTSAIIDGRILDIAKVHFLSGLILVPGFVLTELQQVADSADSIKRVRGRRGFEVIQELKKIKGIKVEVWDKDQSGKDVDAKIVSLAKSLGGRIVTTDYNLNKVATIGNIEVLNVNDLANALKSIALPGESLKVKISQTGKDINQGVGFLEDGTMVIVSGGSDEIGKEISVIVTKNIQSPSGRIIFGKITT